MSDRTWPTDEPALVFGPFRLEIADATLWHGSQSLPLTPKAFSVLQCLVQRRGRLVTKDELYNAVWPGVFVGDAALKVCVLEIRRVLADDAKAPRFIETVHRRGYRFIAPVTDAPESRPAPAAAPVQAPPAVDAPAVRRYVSAAGDPLRQERRRQHRVSGGRRRPARSGVRDGVGVAPRVLLEGAVVRALPQPARVVLAPDPVRQAGDRAVRSRDRAADARRADGRRAGGDGGGGIGARRAARHFRGRADVLAVRRDLSGEDERARDDRHLREAHLGSGLPVGADARNTRVVLRRDPRALGRPGRPRGACAERRRGSGVPRVVEHLPAHGRQPGRGAAPHADERGDRRPVRCCR